MTRWSVLKLGGELLEEPEGMRAIAALIAQGAAGAPLAVVHGGGREIDAALVRAGLPKRQVDGLRITDPATLTVVVEVLAGAINTRLVAVINAGGGRAVGLTGADADVTIVEPAPPHAAVDGRTVDLGLVGRPVECGAPRLLLGLGAAGYVPVVASIGRDAEGRLHNVNADTLAGHLAARLSASRLVVAGGTAGVLDAEGRTIAELDRQAAGALIASGTASAGMVAKLRACAEALDHGVDEVLLVNGREPRAIDAALSGARARATAFACTRMVA